jgi:hypothetical protein
LLVKSFTNENPHKIEGVYTGKTSKFECTITENAKVRACKFREILTLILWPFIKTIKLYCKFRKNLNSEEVKLKFHCIWNSRCLFCFLDRAFSVMKRNKPTKCTINS